MGAVNKAGGFSKGVEVPCPEPEPFTLELGEVFGRARLYFESVDGTSVQICDDGGGYDIEHMGFEPGQLTELVRAIVRAARKDEWLPEAIKACSYAEDLDALEHFVFHPRLNHCSNLCLVCGHGVSDMAGWPDSATPSSSWPEDHAGHKASCVYALKRAELNPRRGELKQWMDDC